MAFQNRKPNVKVAAALGKFNTRQRRVEGRCRAVEGAFGTPWGRGFSPPQGEGPGVGLPFHASQGAIKLLNKYNLENFLSCLFYILKRNHYFCSVMIVELRSDDGCTAC